MPPGLHRVILCADDFALHAGADRAIRQLAAVGRLDAVSCMTRSPGWLAAAAALLDLPAGLQTGVHLNLTEAGVASEGDHCRPLPRMLIESFARLLPRQRIRATIERHLDAYEQVLGKPPDYVDGHQHVHQLPGVIEELTAVLARRYPRERRPWLRDTTPPSGLSSRKAWIIASTRSWRWPSMLERHGLRSNPAFIGVYDFVADRTRYVAAIKSGLMACPDCTLMMCHPAVGPASAGDTIAAARQMEYEFLSSAAWADLLAEAGCVAGIGSVARHATEVACG